MKLAIAGAGTPVGKELIERLQQEGVDYFVIPERLLSADLEAELDQLLVQQLPDQLINLCTFKPHKQTALDLAEPAKSECKEIQQAYAARLANACERHDVAMLQLSTCYVFDGDKRLGYNEQDDVNPAGVYGKTALKGERAVAALKRHVILRTGWLFGRSQYDVIKAWIRHCKRNKGVMEVWQRRFSPTPNEDVARVLLAVCRQIDCNASVWGTYHYCGLETKKEIEFVQQVLKYASQHDEQIYQYLDSFSLTEIPIQKPQVPNTTLSSKKIFDTFGIKQRSWHGSLQVAIKTIYHGAAEVKLEPHNTRTVALPDTLSSRSVH